MGRRRGREDLSQLRRDDDVTRYSITERPVGKAAAFFSPLSLSLHLKTFKTERVTGERRRQRRRRVASADGHVVSGRGGERERERERKQRTDAEVEKRRGLWGRFWSARHGRRLFWILFKDMHKKREGAQEGDDGGTIRYEECSRRLQRIFATKSSLCLQTKPE